MIGLHSELQMFIIMYSDPLGSNAKLVDKVTIDVQLRNVFDRIDVQLRNVLSIWTLMKFSRRDTVLALCIFKNISKAF